MLHGVFEKHESHESVVIVVFFQCFSNVLLHFIVGDLIVESISVDTSSEVRVDEILWGVTEVTSKVEFGELFLDNIEDIFLVGLQVFG